MTERVQGHFRRHVFGDGKKETGQINPAYEPKTRTYRAVLASHLLAREVEAYASAYRSQEWDTEAREQIEKAHVERCQKASAAFVSAHLVKYANEPDLFTYLDYIDRAGLDVGYVLTDNDLANILTPQQA